ncbi:MAG: cytochrome C oxidase subunit I [Gammaproteobacteria bacterium]|jgi:cytochrome oxidase Cu insertion factor (SCO1/SenC/PrrC family)
MDEYRHRRRGRLQLLLLAVVFLGPLALAMYLYYGVEDWRPAGGTNHGTLIEPVVTLPEAPIETLTGETTAPDALRHHWTMLYVNANPCGDTCRQELLKTRQIRLALGAEADRIERLYLYGAEPPAVDWLEETQPALTAAPIDGNPSLAGALPSREPAIYFIDPHGNLMMRFPADADPADIKDDLKKLLKVSRIG